MDSSATLVFSITASAQLTTAFRQKRKDTGRSLRSVARAAEVDPAWLSKVERGLAHADLKLLCRLSALYDVPVGELTSAYVASLVGGAMTAEARLSRAARGSERSAPHTTIDVLPDLVTVPEAARSCASQGRRFTRR